MRYSKFRFWIVFFGAGVIFFAAGGGGAFAGAQIDTPDKAWALLDQGNFDEASKAEVQKFFLGKDVDVNVRDSRGRTPLHAAAMLDDSALAAFLIERGAAIDPVDKDGWTPLGRAAKNMNSKAAAVLARGGGGSSHPRYSQETAQ